MAGSVRFESSSASPEDLAFPGSYANGQRANYSFDRSGSFREGSEGRIFGSASSMSRGTVTSTGDVPSLLQCLTLDPITMGDPKCTRLGELRRVLGISFGTTAEDNSFGAANSKPLPPVATEELKRFKSNVSDSINRARGRTKRLDESIQKLTKYCETSNSKKQQRSEMLTNERSGGSNLLKMGTLMQRNSPDLLTQRLEDRTKNIVLNKRVRSSVAETRAEGRNSIPVRQPLSLVKDRDILKDGGEFSDLVEEKIRRLPAGEGWDKKMKRKRSVGTVLTRPVESDGDLKRVMHHKLNESGLPLSDAQSFRSGSSSGANGINKSDTSLPAGSNVRSIPKNDLEKVTLARDLMAGSMKERIKGTNKLNIREDSNIVCPGSFTKGKASRAPRTGPVMAANSSPNIPRPSGADGWDQPPSINKVNSVGAPNNRKRPMPVGSSSPPMAQWVGQRPQKSSRTRRANLVSPVSNFDEGQMSSEGCTPDLGARTSMGTNGLFTARGVANGTQQIKVKQEHVSSPARLSEIEESGAGENRESRLKEKGIGSNEVEERAAAQSVGPSVLLTKKNRILIKEETVDGVQRQGRSGRGSSYSRTSISPMREKLESHSSSKPLKSTRPGSDKSGSKSGRPPLKKLSERKVFTRVVHASISGSPDFSGESEDDREELLAAANFACNSSYLACSSTFWKKMEPLFASVSLEDISNLKQQLKSIDEYYESLSQTCDRDSDVLDDRVHGEDFLPHPLVSGEKERNLPDQFQSKGPARMLDLADQVQANGDVGGRLELQRKDIDTPLFERVLSALIAEDETEEFEESIGGRYMYSRDDSSQGTCLLIDAESRKRDGIQLEYDPMFGQVQKQCSFDRLACNGDTTFNRGRSIQNAYNDDFTNGGSGLIHVETRSFPELFENGGNGSRAVHTDASSISSFDCQYEQMCLRDKLMLELQSIGLYLESVPDLADREDETIDQDIFELQKAHCQQVGKKKEHLNKILKAMEESKEREGRDLEQVAINRLVELAYKKKLATRGSNASKNGIPKVSKQVAMAFMKRTLARCRKFEETGKSCFTEPALRDVIFAAAPKGNDTESTKCLGLVSRSSVPGGADQHDLHDKFDGGPFDAFGTHSLPNDQDFVKTGPIFNRGRKKEVLLDDVCGSASLRAAVPALGNTLTGGAKGKRSERDNALRNSAAKSGRASTGNFKGERKMKSKPKQKTAQLPTSGNGFNDKLSETTHFVHSSANNISKEAVNRGTTNKKTDGEVKESIDLMEQLDEHPDLSNFLSSINEDEDLGDDIVGLQIPMDDISDFLFQ